MNMSLLNTHRGKLEWSNGVLRPNQGSFLIALRQRMTYSICMLGKPECPGKTPPFDKQTDKPPHTKLCPGVRQT